MAKSFQIRGERRLSCFLPISALGLLVLPLHGVAGAPAEPQARPAAVVASTAPQAAASAQEPPVAASIERIEEALGETGSPLDAVAVDIDNAEYEKAQTFLSAYIRALKAARHRHHGDLARPLILLGDTQFGLGQYDEALQSYAMAVHVSRVSEGLFTPKQVEAVYKQSEALQRLGDEEEAASREEYAFEVLWKTHGPDSEALLPGIFRLAEWHTDRYNIFAAPRPARAGAANSRDQRRRRFAKGHSGAAGACRNLPHGAFSALLRQRAGGAGVRCDHSAGNAHFRL